MQAGSTASAIGVEVIVRLPAAGDDGTFDSLSGKLRGLRVLVVETSEAAAEASTELLELLGSAVQVARDAPQALELARRFKPHAVLLSLGLPGADGYALARRLHVGACPDKPPRLVAVTAYGVGEPRAPWEASCFSAYLVEPLSLEALVDALGAP